MKAYAEAQHRYGGNNKKYFFEHGHGGSLVWLAFSLGALSPPPTRKQYSPSIKLFARRGRVHQARKDFDSPVNEVRLCVGIYLGFLAVPFDHSSQPCGSVSLLGVE